MCPALCFWMAHFHFWLFHALGSRISQPRHSLSYYSSHKEIISGEDTRNIPQLSYLRVSYTFATKKEMADNYVFSNRDFESQNHISLLPVPDLIWFTSYPFSYLSQYFFPCGGCSGAPPDSWFIVFHFRTWHNLTVVKVHMAQCGSFTGIKWEVASGRIMWYMSAWFYLYSELLLRLTVVDNKTVAQNIISHDPAGWESTQNII